MAVADRTGLPVAVHNARATPSGVPLVEATLTQRVVDAQPEPLIGEKADKSDPLAACWAERGMELIGPRRAHRQKLKAQDGRPLRRYKRRRKVERLYAWLQNFRPILVRHEHDAVSYIG